MSLDVYLTMPRASHAQDEKSWEQRPCCTEHEPSGADPGGSCRWCVHCTEWYRPHLENAGCPKDIRVYDANITHNLNAMAEAAGVYQNIWRPEELGIMRACELIKPLRDAVTWMKHDPQLFKRHDASNGWGVYEDFVPWIERYAGACEEYPQAWVCVSR